MQAVDPTPIDGSSGGDERLGSDLAAEDALPLGGEPRAAEDVGLDVLEVEELEEARDPAAHRRDGTLPPMPASSDRLTDRVRELIRNPQVARFIRYSMVSVVSSAVSLVGLYVFYRVAGVKPAALANVCATAVATIPSYYLNRTWAWKRAGKSHLWREVVPFWVIAFISLGLSTGAVALAESVATGHHFSHQGTTIAVEFANFFTYGVLWVGKYVFFNRVLFAHRAEDGDEPAQPDGEVEAVSFSRATEGTGQAAPSGSALSVESLAP